MSPPPGGGRVPVAFVLVALAAAALSRYVRDKRMELLLNLVG